MTNSMDFRFNGPTFFQEIIDGSNFDEKFIKHKLSQAKAHHSALLDHIHNLETENFELKEEKENFLKQSKKNKSPLKRTPFTDNTTMNLMDTEVSVDLDETNATFVCNNGQDNLEFSFFDDNFASIAQNKASKGSRIGKENLNLVGEETMKINFLTKEIELLDEKQAAEDQRDILINENENLKNQIVELCEKLEDSQIALTNAHQTCDQKDRKMIDLESDLEVANEEIIKLNNRNSKFSEMEIKYNDMQKRMETMEIDYLDKKDKVKNGNNLFAEVDERRQYCEDKAIEYRDEILKVRQQRDQIHNQNTILKRKMTKLQELVDNGASAKSYNIDNDPYFINVQKSALHYRDLYQKLQYESHERLQMVEQLRLKFQEDWHFPYDQKKILSRFLDVDRKYKDLQLTFHEKSLEIAKSVKEKDEMEYKLKVLEHFNKLPSDHKCFRMRDQGTDTEEFKKEDEEEKAAAEHQNKNHVTTKQNHKKKMIPKTKIIPRLSIIYKEIFIKSPYDLSSKENAFWDEFFLLSPKYSEFKNYLKNCDAEVLHFLTGKCIFYTQIKENENEKESENQENENENNNNNKLNQIDSTRITNAFKNLSILFQVTSHYPDFFSLLFGCSDVSNETLQILLKNIVYLLEKAVHFDDQLLSNLLIFLNVSISCYAESNDENEPSPAAEPKIQRVASSKNFNPINPFIRIFNTSSILNSLLNLLIIKREAYGNFIITFISLISYYSKYNAELSFNDHNFNHYNAGNAYESFLSNLENKRQLVIIAAHILDKFSYKSKMLLEEESAEAKNNGDDQKPAVASFFGLFFGGGGGSNQQPTQTNNTQKNKQPATSSQNPLHQKSSSFTQLTTNETLELLFLKELIELNNHFIPMIFLISPEKFRFSCKNDEFLSPTVSNESENFKSKNYDNKNDSNNKGRKTADHSNNRRQSIAALTKREDYNRILDMEETLNSENLISSHLNRINSCLLSIFLEYLSLLMKNVRNSAQNNSNNFNNSSNIQNSINQATIYNRTKIGFSILANIVEDVFACTEIFNIENKFIVNIHKVSMRHRKKFGNNPCFNEDFIPSDQECLKYQELRNPVSSNSSNLAAGDHHQNHQQSERRTSSQPFKMSDANCTPMAQFLNPNKPLAYWILTLCIEFILTNLSRQNFPVEIYSRVLTIIHRLLIQMKRYEIRLTMPFPNLWHALITLIKFIKNKNYCKIQVMSLNSTQSNNSNSKIKQQSKQDEAAKNRDLLLVLKQTIDIFNIFITFGDSFLQCPKQYDRLFYEIIRLEDVFVACEEFIKGFGGEMLEIEKIEGQLEGTMEQMKEKQVQEFVAASVETQLGNIEPTITSSNSSDNNPLNPPLTITQPDVELQILKNLSSNVLFSLKNILDIINHFSPKIANHCKTNKIPSLTEKQVLTLVRENYTDLILCMNENLEMVDSIDIVYDKNFADADMERGLVDVARDTYGRELEEFLSD